MGFLGRWLVTTVACAAAIWIVPGIEAVGGSWEGPVACALVLALLNATIKPVLQTLAIPFTVATLGVFYVVVNAMVLELASWLSLNMLGIGIEIFSFGSALLGAVIISIVSMLLGGVVGDD